MPCLFWTRLEAVFVVPKLAALWGALVLACAVVAAGVLFAPAPLSAARRVPPVDAAVAAFVLLNVAAWAFSTDRRQSLYGERLQYQGLLTLLLYVAFFVVARLAITDGRRLRLLAWSVALGGTLVSAYALVQRAGLDPVWHGFLPGGRVFSSIGVSNALAAYLVVAIPVTVPLVHGASRARQRLLLGALAAMIAAFAFTLSRGGLLGFAAAAVVLAAGWRSVAGRRPRSVGIGVALAIAAVATVVVVLAPERLALDFRTDLSLGFHRDAWEVAAHVAVDHPLLGTGQETFPDVFPRYSHAVLPGERAAEYDTFRVESPHSAYLGIAAGAGLPALVAYLAFVLALAFALLHAARHASRELGLLLVGVLAAACGHLVTDAFMTPDLTSSWLFWLLGGAALGAAASSRPAIR